MIKVGVIGCGKIAQTRHLPEYANNPDCQIVAVYDLNGDRANEFAARYGAKAYKSFDELIAQKDIDAVSICVANNAHCEMTVKALKAGKNVLCEKPMATTIEECELMVKTAKDTGKFLMIGHNQRLSKAHDTARQLIKEDVIGQIITFKTNFGHSGPETWTIDTKTNWFFDKTRAGLGAIADLGIHKTDLIQFLTGQTITEVTAFVVTLDKKDKNGQPINVDDNTICIYKMSGGAVGTMTVSWTYYGAEDNSTILYGTKGIMHIYEDPKYAIVVEKKNGEKIKYEIDKIQTNDNQTKSGVIDLWVDCLKTNTSPEISGEDAMNSMKAVFAALKSAKEQRTIKVE
ncbi:MAG: Gfo/Idh/MocA family oxidoreductase [Anaerolineaceae bacterium]